MAGRGLPPRRDHVRRRAHAHVPASPLRRPARNGTTLRAAGRRLMEIAVPRGPHASSAATWARSATTWARRRRRRAGCASIPGRRTCCSRAWTPSSGADGPRFIEINSDAPAGFGYGDRMAEVFAELPLFRAFAEDAPLSTTSRPRPALVEAVVWAWRTAGRPGAPRARHRHRGLGGREDARRPGDPAARASRPAGIAACSPIRARWRSRAAACCAGGRPVDVVYRRAVLTELVAREGRCSAFLEAYRDGLAVFVNSFRCQLSEDKAFFAILTDEAFASLMTAEEAAARCGASCPGRGGWPSAGRCARDARSTSSPTSSSTGAEPRAQARARLRRPLGARGRRDVAGGVGGGGAGRTARALGRAGARGHPGGGVPACSRRTARSRSRR